MTPSLCTAGRVGAVFALLSVTALISACSAPVPPPRPRASVAPPVGSGTRSPGGGAPVGARASSAAPSTSASASSHPAPQPQPCPTGSLQATTGAGQGAAGSTYVPIIFTNVSGVACTLYGYPGVSLAGGSPLSQIGLAATENSATSLQLVTLGPGEQASALLRIVSAQNYPPGRCGLVHTTYLQVYPPRQTAPIYVAYSSAACKKPIHLLSVDVVKPGSGG